MNCNTNQNIGIQGHRGCRGLMPENTLPAFKKAIALGVHTLELDVVISKDNKVIVSHEPFMSRTYCLDRNGNEIPKEDDKKYNLYTLSHEEIKAFDCGTKLHKRYPNQEKIKTYKPSLKEVFVAANALSNIIKYNIEIKAKRKYDAVFTPKPKEFVALVLKAIKENQVFERCNLQSFDLRVLEEIKKQAPEMKVAILVDKDQRISKKLHKLSYKPEIISPYFKLLDKKTTQKYQKQGFKVIPWTVNSAANMQEMIQCSVDGIITDFPDVLLQILQQNQ
ncbi:glycerophosphodiester phosphodiesterase [Lacinutrix sp. C3R15]|uniref:glycerophosphodiester phosphodiesterase family protein n=1 Tax=Flavobacteriaceae TaxID=49546 RepID=UPI001C08771A|nr:MULTISPECIES: glycerophosphodiester phosphodiesterase family protein [Flavobacteriaceae]MBU2939643.1 glycerophosphodiester phosphodiesterase [Lacinutrix sp. C3R15]MDO6622958.1 glycerophosphodiester phosphodiesterase family protein [Oceanihabitans sp. 1_MG-2023]